MMYAGSLGGTLLNSLGDMMGLTARVGLGRVVKNLAGSLGSSIKNAMRDMLHFPKSEQRQILDSLCLGIEENKINSMLKINPIQSDELFYGASNADIYAKMAYKTGKLADFVNRASGMRYWDDLYKRIVGKIVLEDLAKGSKEIQNMIAKKEFSKEVEEKIYREVRKITNKPGLADVPHYAYHPLGKLFYSMQSWVFANSSSYLYPMIKGQFKGIKVAESVFFNVCAQMINVYVRKLAQGEAFDFDEKEDVEEFEKQVFDKSMDAMAGVLSIYWGASKAIYRGRRSKSVGSALENLTPVVGYWGRGLYNFSNVIGGCMGLYAGELSDKTVRKAARLIPGNNIWYLEGVTSGLSKGVADAVNN